MKNYLSRSRIDLRQRMLPPMLIERLWLLIFERFAVIVFINSGFVILARVRATTLLSFLGGHDGLHRVDHEILQFESFHEIGIPYQRSVGNLDFVEFLVDIGHLPTA